jgi:hypothetical protein
MSFPRVTTGDYGYKSVFCSTTVTFWWQASICSSLRSRGTYQTIPFHDKLLSFSNCSALSILTSVTAVPGLPLPSVVNNLIVPVLYTFYNIFNVSSLLLPSITQNSIAYVCLNPFPSGVEIYSTLLPYQSVSDVTFSSHMFVSRFSVHILIILPSLAVYAIPTYS